MKTTLDLPLLPLRDVVVYPHMVIPLFVGREKSIEALEAAMTGEKQILLLAQKNPADDDPGEDALYLSLIHISEPTRRHHVSRMPSSA